ncbi:MAG: ABC transporter ATP-binding protein [Anaerolineales bacterium]|jgi:ATP-binding cassette subfamily B protein
MYHGGRGWWALVRQDESKGKPTVDRALLKRVYGYARPYLGVMVVVLVFILITSLIQLVPPLLYRDLFDNVIPDKDIPRLVWLSAGMIGIPLAASFLDVAQRYFSARLGEGVIHDLRQGLYEHLQNMSLRFFTHTRRGEIVSRLNSDVVGAQSAVTNTIPNVITNTFSLITTLAVMFSIEWRLTLLAVIVLPLFLLPARRIARLLRDVRRQAMEYNADMSSMISETLTINGALLVKTFGRQQFEKERFKEVNEKVRDTGVRRALIGRWFFVGLGIAATIGTGLVYGVGGYLAILETISLGTIVAFVSYLVRLYMPISALSNIQVEFITSMVSFERVFEFMDLPVEIEDKPDALVLQDVSGRIRFENVSFDYMEANQRLGIKMLPFEQQENGSEEGKEDVTPSFIPTRRYALENLNFEIEPGQLVALVGPSGAGKTTLTYMLPRLYDPTEGNIFLDGYNLRDVTQKSLAGQLGIVTQETYLFHDTIRRNLTYARADAGEEELVAAAKAANIYDFIQKLPKGFDTVVGERGYRLSGGEKQRLAIARVVLKDPRVLILDEATSHLDSTSEALIQQALEPLMHGRTSLVIAHRLSTILAADKILVLDNGKLVEQGTHDELLAVGGLYAELYETQFRNQLEMRGNSA